MFGTYVFKISPATAYSQASCADVKVGVHVYIAGTKRDGDSFVAVTGLGIKRDGAPGPTPAPTTPTTPTPAPAPVPVSFDATVTVSSVVATSACPYREFMVGDYRLTTSAMTRYDHGGCGDIAPGATLAIVATKGSRDTSVLVSSITFKDAEVTPPGTETVSSDLTIDRLVSETSCPALSFTGRAVHGDGERRHGVRTRHVHRPQAGNGAAPRRHQTKRRSRAGDADLVPRVSRHRLRSHAAGDCMRRLIPFTLLALDRRLR